MGPFQTTIGTVVSFNEYKGWGTLKDAQGSELPFHCTAIADGSRTIAIGQPVEFDLIPGRAGRWEASNLRAC